MSSDDSFDEIPDYEDEDEQSVSSEPVAKKKRGAGNVWKSVQKFDTKEAAISYIKQQGTWAQRTSSSTIDGRKVYYRCNKNSKSSILCPAAVYLLYDSTSDAVILFRTENDHCHQENESRTYGIDIRVRSEIDQLYSDRVTKPKQILAALRNRSLPQPTKKQLANYLQRLKRKKFGKVSITLGELEEWCQSRSTPPVDDPNAAYVVRYATGTENGDRCVRIFISTSRLLQIASSSNIIQADATYKLIWHGFPVLVVGTSDKNRRFFPFGISTCSNEAAADFRFLFQSIVEGVSQICNASYSPNILIADASDAITNGFIDVFGKENKRVYCWFHVIKAIDHKLDKISDRDIRKRLREDILHLQLSLSPEIFYAITRLFFEKWSLVDRTDVDDFLSYFKSEWIDQHESWYEGYAIGAPSTNNSLEAINSTIKKEQTLRERLPLSHFLHLVAEKILVQWSQECDPNVVDSKKFVTVASNSLYDWTNAFQWATGNQSILQSKLNKNVYYITSSLAGPVTKDSISKYRSSFKDLNWDTFDDYVMTRYGIWVVEIDGIDWRNATCTCPSFLKKYGCKHSLGLAIRLKYCDAEIPSAAKSIPIGAKRKRGRPKQATAALIRD